LILRQYIPLISDFSKNACGQPVFYEGIGLNELLERKKQPLLENGMDLTPALMLKPTPTVLPRNLTSKVERLGIDCTAINAFRTANEPNTLYVSKDPVTGKLGLRVIIDNIDTPLIAEEYDDISISKKQENTNSSLKYGSAISVTLKKKTVPGDINLDVRVDKHGTTRDFGGLKFLIECHTLKNISEIGKELPLITEKLASFSHVLAFGGVKHSNAKIEATKNERSDDQILDPYIDYSGLDTKSPHP